MAQAAETLDPNLEFLKQIKEEQDMTHRQMARLTCYNIETVRAWFAPPGSSKYRAVPDRAVEIAKAKLSSGAN